MGASCAFSFAGFKDKAFLFCISNRFALVERRVTLNSQTRAVGYSRQNSKHEKTGEAMLDCKSTKTPGLPLLLCGQGLQVERELAGAFRGDFSDVCRSGLRLTFRWASCREIHPWK